MPKVAMYTRGAKLIVKKQDVKPSTWLNFLIFFSSFKKLSYSSRGK
jgi:hypothetical protein